MCLCVCVCKHFFSHFVWRFTTEEIPHRFLSLNALLNLENMLFYGDKHFLLNSTLNSDLQVNHL